MADRAELDLTPRALIVGGLSVRAAEAGDTASERIIEGIVVPFDTPTMVRDAPGGPTYREVIRRGATDHLDPSSVMLEAMDAPAAGQLHAGAVLVGRGFAGEVRPEGHFMAFRVSRTRAGDDALELARDGVTRSMSVVFAPVEGASRTLADGTVERSAIDVRRVAVLEHGAYPGAQVTAVRADGGTAMPTTGTAPAQPADQDEDEDQDEATQAPQGARPNRTRVNVQVDAERGATGQRESARAAAERDTVASFGRGGFAPGQGRTLFEITRSEPMYGPGTGRSFFGDGWRARNGDAEAAERLRRHYALLGDVEVAMERAGWYGGSIPGLFGRAGDVLSSEIPGAYPTDYLPGLLVPRILKQRPMGGFYQKVSIADGRPRVYPVVSTSTSVAAQGAEGANPAASDFATTATTVTPTFYGGETKVSRQVLDGADPSIDAMLNQDLTEAYSQASEAVIRAAVEAGSTASGVTLTAATPNSGLIDLVLNHLQTVFLPAGRLFLPTTLTSSWLKQNDTTGRPLAPVLNPYNSSGLTDIDLPLIGQILQTLVAQSWSSTAGAGAGVGGVAVVGRDTDFAIFESPLVSFTYDQGAEAPSAVRIGVWAYLTVGTRRGSRKATGA